LLQKLEFLLFKLLEMAALSFSPWVTSVASSIIDTTTPSFLGIDEASLALALPVRNIPTFTALVY